MSTTTRLPQLPDDILFLILGQCNSRTLAKLAATHSRLKLACYQAIYTHLEIHHWYTVPQLLLSASAWTPYLTHLEFHALAIDPYHTNLNLWWCYCMLLYIDQSRLLSVIDLSNLRPDSIASLFIKKPNAEVSEFLAVCVTRKLTIALPPLCAFFKVKSHCLFIERLDFESNVCVCHTASARASVRFMYLKIHSPCHFLFNSDLDIFELVLSDYSVDFAPPRHVQVLGSIDYSDAATSDSQFFSELHDVIPALIRPISASWAFYLRAITIHDIHSCISPIIAKIMADAVCLQALFLSDIYTPLHSTLVSVNPLMTRHPNPLRQLRIEGIHNFNMNHQSSPEFSPVETSKYSPKLTHLILRRYSKTTDPSHQNQTSLLIPTVSISYRLARTLRALAVNDLDLNINTTCPDSIIQTRGPCIDLNQADFPNLTSFQIDLLPKTTDWKTAFPRSAPLLKGLIVHYLAHHLRRLGRNSGSISPVSILKLVAQFPNLSHLYLGHDFHLSAEHLHRLGSCLFTSKAYRPRPAQTFKLPDLCLILISNAPNEFWIGGKHDVPLDDLNDLTILPVSLMKQIHTRTPALMDQFDRQGNFRCLGSFDAMRYLLWMIHQLGLNGLPEFNIENGP